MQSGQQPSDQETTSTKFLSAFIHHKKSAGNYCVPELFYKKSLVEQMAESQDLDAIYLFLSSMPLNEKDLALFEKRKLEVFVLILSLDEKQRTAAIERLSSTEHQLGRFFGAEFHRSGKIGALLNDVSTPLGRVELLQAPLFRTAKGELTNLGEALSTDIDWDYIKSHHNGYCNPLYYEALHQYLEFLIDTINGLDSKDVNQAIALLTKDVINNGCLARKLFSTKIAPQWIYPLLSSITKLGASTVDIFDLLNQTVKCAQKQKFHVALRHLHFDDNYCSSDQPDQQYSARAYLGYLQTLAGNTNLAGAQSIVAALQDKDFNGKTYLMSCFSYQHRLGINPIDCIALLMRLQQVGVPADDLQRVLDFDHQTWVEGTYCPFLVYLIGGNPQNAYDLLDNNLVTPKNYSRLYEDKEGIFNFILTLPVDKRISALEKALDVSQPLGKVMLTLKGRMWGEREDTDMENKMKAELKKLCPSTKAAAPAQARAKPVVPANVASAKQIKEIEMKPVTTPMVQVSQFNFFEQNIPAAQLAALPPPIKPTPAPPKQKPAAPMLFSPASQAVSNSVAITATASQKKEPPVSILN